MNLPPVVTSSIRIHEMCYYFHPRCQTNTFFDKNILWIISNMTPSPINVLLGLIICTPPHLQTNGLHALDFMGRCWRCKNISFLILRIFIAQYISLVYFQIFGQQRMQQNGFSHIRNYILIHSSF